MMLRRTILLGLLAAVSSGVTCQFTTPSETINVPLDEANAVITISQVAGDTEADVVAIITTGLASAVTLEGDQAVAVNDQALQGPDVLGRYERTITAADTYTVTVSEPTRGVEETTITAPGAFDITAPAAGATVSLAGFNIAWSNPDATLQVRVTLTQTIFGYQRTQSFGPFADTGTLPLSVDQLRLFGQGANLQIALTKINERAGVNGFNSATLSAELTQVVVAVPGT